MKLFINNRLRRTKSRSAAINTLDIARARRILFCVLSRYGDGIISFRVINQFIERYPDKDYIVLTSRQQLPYANEIVGRRSNIEIRKVNKRNPWSFYSTLAFLKKKNIDIGFNPWGHGNDSEFFCSYAQHFHFYKIFDKFKKTDNLYDRIREYLQLEIVKEKQLQSFELKVVNKILLAPISTDATKNLTAPQTNFLIERVRASFPQAAITTALPISDRNAAIQSELFLFQKSSANSLRFLAKLKQADLFIGVDSGPLHLALALGIPSIAVFGPTSPITILDHGQKVKYLRSPLLKNTFCYVKECNNPVCINTNILSEPFAASGKLDDEALLVTNHCSMEPKR